MNVTYFEEVFEFFLAKVSAYEEFTGLTDEEMMEEFKIFLKMALARFDNADNIIADFDMECFNRILTYKEIEIISLSMVISWLSPKINNVDLLKQRLTSKDYGLYSQANHLKELMDLKSNAENEFNRAMINYGLKSLMKDGGSR